MKIRDILLFLLTVSLSCIFFSCSDNSPTQDFIQKQPTDESKQPSDDSVDHTTGSNDKEEGGDEEGEEEDENVSTSVNPDFHVYLCFGQSNMEGNAIIEEQDKKHVSERFLMMAAVDNPDLNRIKGEWYTAIPPLARRYTGLTPADYFGRKLVESLPEDISVGVINVSVAGCGIDLFNKDKFATYLPNQADWLKNIVKEYEGNPYNCLIQLAKKAQNRGVIKGILLHQGESNTGDVNWPTNVKEIYEDMLADLDLKAEDVPLLVGEVVHANQNGVCAYHNLIIAEIPTLIPTAYVISSDGCPAAADNLHFSAEGYRILGRRYADKMLSLLEIDK